MLLQITSTATNAPDLGYLLGKHPAKLQTFSLANGVAHVFYPHVAPDRCTAVLLLDMDPIGLVRRAPGAPPSLFDYVNDRPYVASSFLAVAIAQVYRSALAGTCKEMPELAQTALPLEITLESLPCRGGEKVLRELFEPLGYVVACERLPLDIAFAEWGPSPYFRVQLQTTAKLCDVLCHLYVLVPVLDADKHYFVDQAEGEKLLAKGAGWLAGHPCKEAIVQRYLGRHRGLAREVLGELAAVSEEATPDDEAQAREDAAERPLCLNQTRYQAVVETIVALGAREVADLGCGDGKLLRELLKLPQLQRIIGVDVSPRCLQIAERRLKLQQMPDNQRQRIELLHGSLSYRDKRLAGLDVCTLIEVIEHMEVDRLPALAQALFGSAMPRAVVVTTPNVEYNSKFASLPAGKLRHSDHRFEWTRAEFQAWAQQIATTYGYGVRFAPVGPPDPQLGAPTQMAVFERALVAVEAP